MLTARGRVCKVGAWPEARNNNPAARCFTLPIMAGFLNICTHPLFFCDAQHRMAGVQVLPLQCGDVLELGVAVGMTRPHLHRLARLAFDVPVLLERLLDHTLADRCAAPPGAASPAISPVASDRST